MGMAAGYMVNAAWPRTSRALMATSQSACAETRLLQRKGASRLHGNVKGGVSAVKMPGASPA